MMKTFKITLIAICCTTLCMAQDFKTDINAFSELLKANESYSSNIKVAVFPTAGADEPLIVQNYAIKKHKESFKYFLNGTEVLLNKKCLVVVDPEEMVVHYTPASSEKKKETSGVPDLNIDSLLNKSDSIVFMGVENNRKKFNIYSHDKMIAITELYINVKDNTLSQLTFLYNPNYEDIPEKVVVNYSDWNTNPQYKEGEFSEKKYVLKKGNTRILASTYSNYQLIEHQ